MARATDYFNAHPYLAGIAVGAAARAERDGVAGSTIQRLRTALSGPLGSLGDQLFWIGVVPAVIGIMLIAVALGAGFAPVAAGLGFYLVVRVLVTIWGLELGLGSGLGVSAALQRSGLADHARRAGLAAGLSVGVAVPIVARWFAAGLGSWAVVAMATGAVAGVVAALVRFRVISARRLTLLAMVVMLAASWSLS
jgi:PTS system mannose-specific IID component